MTHHDIPACAHMLTHAFGENGKLNLALQNPNFSQMINNWMARLRITLCDHVSFVVEDTEFSGDPEMENCKCQENTSVDLKNGKSKRKGIVSLIVGYDLASRMVNFVAPSTFHRGRAIRVILQKLGKKRMNRIREEENKLLTKEQRRVKEEREKEKEKEKAEKKEEIHSEIPYHLARERDHDTDTCRTFPISGEGLEVWLLATRASYVRHHLASALSHVLVAYVRAHTMFQFLAIEAAHPATERIWTSAGIEGRVMARVKTQDFEFLDESGEKIFPFASVGPNALQFHGNNTLLWYLRLYFPL
eukprot:Phypoly_transcript_13581.p1 GENE.Phypoly_transcript_13581~~Phypoly_transcript_13581.p1  ORF type:complete len:318 (+),score=61.47 Phypoly_transcript_13581:46-954(+)